jgi:23S rRNA pseudouridine1911/1915/1917 synthase
VPLQQKTLTIPETLAGQRADRAVLQMCSLSRDQINGLFDHGCIRRNGTVCQMPWERLQLGDVVEVNYDPHQRYHTKRKPPKNLGFEIIHEDEHLIVVNKPPAWLTVPTTYGETNTLINRISAYLSLSGKKREAFVAHRLDRGVSGLLVFGKSLEMAQKLRDQFELRKPQREYVAIVRGSLETSEGTFRTHLATGDNLTRYSTDESPETQLAITHYRVIEALRDATLVQIWLETGRRNQIRVHFAEVHHPVLGDPRYEPALAQHASWNAKRIALHARSLGFQHPVSLDAYRFESELPAAFVEFIKQASLHKSRRNK